MLLLLGGDDAAFRLEFRGGPADAGEMPASELADALQGWDRLIQLAMYAQLRAELDVPTASHAGDIELRVRRVDRGSVIVDAVVWMADNIAGEVFATLATAGAIKAWPWIKDLWRTQIEVRQSNGTEDDLIQEIEKLAAKDYAIRVAKNREKSEKFVSSLSAAVSNASTPLESSATEMKALVGKDTPLAVTRADRRIIMTPLMPPAIEPDEGVIEARVRFIRINKSTGKGLFQFVHPRDETQVATQRFHCVDASIRKRANQYTGAFHHDTGLLVRLQRKAYEVGRHGHYWLMDRVMPDEGPALFGGTSEQDG